MKRLTSTLAVLVFAISILFAQAPPQAINYQTVARDASGNIVQNQAVSFRLSILEDNAGGTVAYSETHSATTNLLGLVDLEIGNGTVVSGTFAGIDWPGHTHYLKVEFDVTGGTSYILMGTAQLVSVPYAMHAGTADVAITDKDEQQLTFSNDTIFISNGNFIVLPGCNDGVLNFDETGVDCGGATCVSCAALCSDGTMNGDETGVDCGGSSCVSCATLCSDGTMNGDETGVDCGGTSCVSCAARCTDGILNGDEIGIDCGGTSCSACSAQQLLDGGKTPKEIFDLGYTLNQIYGLTYEGGLIFYLNTTTGAGFVAAPSDQSINDIWGCHGTSIGTATGIGTGANNTLNIDNNCAGGHAAHLCQNLILNTYSDWFLPSRDESGEMYTNLKANGHGNFASDNYWTSTQGNANTGGQRNFLTGGYSNLSKTNNFRVRAARAFN